jgi:hypothetical protein
MTDGLAINVVASIALLAVQATLTLRTLRLPPQAPNRLVAELRLAQLSALVLAMTSGMFVGLAAVSPDGLLDVLLALAFFTVAAVAQLRDPREGLTMLALAFAAHAVVDVLHRPGLLSEHLAPSEVLFVSAVHHALAGALCYLPLLRR